MKKQVSRIILMIAGVLTVVVILLSQSLYKETPPSKQKQKTEEAVVIQAPADVVPSPSVQMDEVFPTLLKALIRDEEGTATFFSTSELFTPYLKMLFRAIISPNAP